MPPRARLALIGCGKWGRNYIQAAKDAGNCEVTKVLTRADRVEDIDADAVVIAVHPNDAPAIAVECRERGLPIMIEKPVGLSLAAAERVANAGSGPNGLVLVNHQHLFAARYEEMRWQLGWHRIVRTRFTGPVVRDYSATWDYGSHAVACMLGLPCLDGGWQALISHQRQATVGSIGLHDWTLYDGYDTHEEPPLTRSVRAFAKAVADGGTDDYRFGAHWAVNVNRILEAADRRLKG